MIKQNRCGRVRKVTRFLYNDSAFNEALMVGCGQDAVPAMCQYCKTKFYIIKQNPITEEDAP